MVLTSITQRVLDFTTHASNDVLQENSILDLAEEKVVPIVEDISVVDLDWPNDLGFDTLREEHDPIDLAVTGHIPAYASGVLYRNGPGAREVRNGDNEVKYQLHHWFDGFAQLHRFEITHTREGNTCVRYNSRINVDSLIESLAETGELGGFTFAQKRDPCMSFFRKVMSVFKPTPALKPNFQNIAITVSANTVGMPLPENLGHRGNGIKALVARTDESTMKALDPETLEPIGIARQSSLHPSLTGPLSATHAKSDPLTGDVYNYNLELGYFTTYRIFRTLAATGETEIVATISDPSIPPAYIHSFFLTTDYVVLCVWNSHLAAGGLQVLWEKNVLDGIASFDPSKSAKWLVVDRKKGQGLVAVFESPAMFAFHAVNSWQEPTSDGKTNIICDVVAYDSLDVLHKYYYENLRSSSQQALTFDKEHPKAVTPDLVRFRLPGITPVRLKSYTATLDAEEILRIPSPQIGELPTINTRYATKPYRYIYSLPSRGRSTFVDALSKVDIVTQTCCYWDGPAGHTPSEAIFVPDPAGTEEDDGVLLTVVLDGFCGTSYLLCLDARDLSEMGRADCGGPLSFSFHGQHVRVGDDYARPLDV